MGYQLRKSQTVLHNKMARHLRNIWEEEAIGADNTVAVHIRHIREKIEINPKEPKYLKVVWGVGYNIEKL